MNTHTATSVKCSPADVQQQDFKLLSVKCVSSGNIFENGTWVEIATLIKPTECAAPHKRVAFTKMKWAVYGKVVHLRDFD